MGRYYNGDIEGKFWFAVQSSCDGEYFGMEQEEHTHIPYYSDDLELAEEGIKQCKKELSGYLMKMDKFFNSVDSYNDTTLAEALDLEGEKYDAKRRHLMVWYARLRLGKQIASCIKDTGSCWYEAEL
jgi:hypothetical protein